MDIKSLSSWSTYAVSFWTLCSVSNILEIEAFLRKTEQSEDWYQEEGKPDQLLKAGDVVVTHDGVQHWHGATTDNWFKHIAITAGTPEWLEPVDDEIYNKL